MQDRIFARLLCGAAVLTSAACFHAGASDASGSKPILERAFDSDDVRLPPGYRIERVAKNLTFPTSVTFDDEGRVYVVEAGYCYGEACSFPRLLRIDGEDEPTVLLRGRNGPWTGAVYHDGGFYLAEGGEFQGGRILRYEGGKTSVLVDYLPSIGDHHTNGPLVGPDGQIYFAIGSATNAGVVGTDSAELGWLKRYPKFRDVPCRDVVLSGHNFETDNPLSPSERRVKTGAYLPFGVPSAPGQVISGRTPCTSAIFRIGPAGGRPELVAWGFRNPFGLAFGLDGELYVADSGFDVRGSRPVFGAADTLWQVVEGAWYGFPDYAEGQPVFDKRHRPPGGPVPPRLLSRTPSVPPRPVARFAVHSSSTGLDFSRSKHFGHVGEAFVAQFGDMATATGTRVSPVGFRVVSVDVRTGVIYDFAVNTGGQGGPASRRGTRGLERPISVRFDPTGRHLYVVDFGILAVNDGALEPRALTGALFRISYTRTER